MTAQILSFARAKGEKHGGVICTDKAFIAKCQRMLNNAKVLRDADKGSVANKMMRDFDKQHGTAFFTGATLIDDNLLFNSRDLFPASVYRHETFTESFI